MNYQSRTSASDGGVRWTLAEPLPWQASGIQWTPGEGWATWRDDPDNEGRIERGEPARILCKRVPATEIPDWAIAELARDPEWMTA